MASKISGIEEALSNFNDKPFKAEGNIQTQIIILFLMKQNSMKKEITLTRQAVPYTLTMLK